MELTTRLGQDRFAWMKDTLGRDDLAHLLVEVKAPALESRSDTTPTQLVVVLDRSGSMDGAPLDHAKRALRDVVDRLSSTDSFGLVTFDDQVEVPVPAGRVTDRRAIKKAIDDVYARGMTDLGAGLVRGLQEASRIQSPSGVRVLLISDGHANSGIVDPDVLGGHVGTLVDRRITTSTLGMGLGYDERLLSAIARRGAGEEHFAEEADTAAGAIAQECGELLNQRFLSCRLTVTIANGIEAVSVLNEATAQTMPDGAQIELGGFKSEDLGSLVLRFKPKQATRPGRRKIAMLRLDYVLADDLSEHSVSSSVWTHVSRPGERPPVVDHDVMAEVLFQRVQRRKRKGMLALSQGDVAHAEQIFEGVVRLVKRSWATIPLDRRADFAAELDLIDGMNYRIQFDAMSGVTASAKLMSADVNMKSRRRGRSQPLAPREDV